MAIEILLLIGGGLLVALTLADVFDTVVVPGGSRTSMRVARRLARLLLPLWKAVRGRRRGLSALFAPTVLVGCFTIWMFLLCIGFAMMSYALPSSFHPPLKSFWDGFYLVGSSLVTVGLSETNATGPGRWVVLVAGFCGLAVMTMAVTYLLTVQSSIAKRDIGIIKLNTSAGEPPSALTLLEKFAAIGNRAELGEVLKEGRNWCATVRQSHSSHPSLIYFQSVGIGAGWPAALGALLDLALIAERMLDEPDLRGPAILLREEALRMAEELAELLDVHRERPDDVTAALEQVAARLREAGYGLQDVDAEAVARARAEHESCVKGLADHLGRPGAILVR